MDRVALTTRQAHEIMKDLGQRRITTEEAYQRSQQVESSSCPKDEKEKLEKWKKVLAEHKETPFLKTLGAAGAIVRTLNGFHELILLEAKQYAMNNK